MKALDTAKEKISKEGFAVIENVFSDSEADNTLQTLANIDAQKTNVRKAAGLFAVRQVLKEAPDLKDLLFTQKFKSLIAALFGNDYFVIKSIYFDKPAHSNWAVSYHQDLTISVDKKVEAESFTNWTVKPNDYAVQPPLTILEDNFTVRIHLDDTDENNGALRVVPQSHRKGIYRPEAIDRTKETEVVCKVPKGGVMVMKPLLLHASSRTTNDKSRRVLHVEFSRQALPEGLNWVELYDAQRPL